MPKQDKPLSQRSLSATVSSRATSSHTASSSLSNIKSRIFIHRMLSTSALSLAVFVLGFIFLPVLLAEANATNIVNADIRWSVIDLTLDPDVVATNSAVSTAVAQALEDAAAEKGSALTEEETATVTASATTTATANTLASSTHGDVAFGTIVPTAKNTATNDYGTMVIKKKTIGVTTRGSYYAVYLSMNNNATGSNNAPVASDTALNYDGTTDTSMRINATSGTWDSPKTLAQNGTSGWGYMVPGTLVKQSDGTTDSAFGALNRSTVATNFASYLDQNIYSTAGATYSTSIWAGVPVKNAPQQIWKAIASTSAGFSTQDTFDVYYALNVDTDVMAGNYENQILYTAIASAESLDSVSTNLARTVKYGAEGQVQTIYFDLAQTTGGAITGSDINVYLVPHDVMDAANYNINNLSAADKTAAYDRVCAVNANSFTSVTTTAQAATEGSTSSIQCTMPADSDSSVEYDYWLEIAGYNFNYVSKIDNGAEAGFAYVGLQTKRTNGTPYITDMQDMSAGVCANTNIWKGSLGSSAALYDPTGTTPITVATTETRAEAITANKLPSDYATATTADTIGTFALKDTRDGKRYLVRRLADGNCWMTQNLNLDLYTGMTLTSADTDLNGERTTWTIASTAENTNDEVNENIVLELTSGTSKGLAWKSQAGSASKAWQTAHGIEEVTLIQYNYTSHTEEDEGTGEETTVWSWEPTTIAYCEDGTAQQPCFATASTGIKYYKEFRLATQADVDNEDLPDVTAVGQHIAITPVEATAAVALDDGYKTNDTTGSPIRGFEAGAYYATISYQVRKVNAPNLGSGTAYSATTLGPDGTATNPGTCSYSYYNDHLRTDSACVITTAGDAMITQFSNDGTGIGMNSTEIPRLAITKDHNGNSIDFMNNTSSENTAFTYSDATYTVFPMSTTGADYRWVRNGRDGAHVMDTGPMYFANSYAESTVQVDGQDTTYYTMTFGNGQSRCANLGTVQGTLTDPTTGNPYNFVSCMDGSDASAQALADSRVDGNWYNWYAAVAGSEYISGGASTRAADSICPKGWKLPSNNASNSGVQDFYGLIKGGYGLGNNTDNTQNDNKTISNSVDAMLGVFPLSFSRSGSYAWLSGGLNNRGYNGYYWSAASGSDTNSYNLSFNSSALNPRNNNYKGYGFAVRCVASAE